VALAFLAAVAWAALTLPSRPARAATRPPFSVLLPRAASLLPRPAQAERAVPAGEVAMLARPTPLRSSPAGRPLAQLAPYTEFGSPRALAVVGRDGPWLAVLATELPNGRSGWIAASATVSVADPYTLEVDRARRVLTAYRDGRVVRRAPVAVGTALTPTPAGSFAVTDKLTTNGPSPYGCCVLALSGHQTRLAAGWTGGDRLAIHATLQPDTIGQAESLGCMRASTADARWLVSTIPLGTLVSIH
jgi:lipoprotein-anchoring transpeptidase ErfK/SrfK